MSNMETIVYLIRHSKKIDYDIINNENNKENDQNRREKIILSIEGEKRAKILSMQDELQNVNVIYSSNYSRALQTAKYLAEIKKLKINVDNRFNEKTIGVRTDEDISIKQYYDENIKNKDGESRKEVSTRMLDGFFDVVNKNKEKVIAIFTHGAAMKCLLMNWCKLESVTSGNNITLSFNGKIIIDKRFNAPETFKITLDENNKIKNIEHVVFKDLE